MRTSDSREDVVLATVRCIERLAEMGFSEPSRLVRAMPRLPFLDHGKVRGLLDFLTQQGAKSPHWIIQNTPGIIPAELSAIEQKLSAFRSLGFRHPIATADKCPSFLSYSVGRVRGRLRSLRVIGCLEPVAVVERFPAIPGYSSEYFKQHVRGISSRSLDVVRIISACPAVFGQPLSGLDKKIDLLRSFGVEAPQVLFNKVPLMFECSYAKLATSVRVLRETTPDWMTLLTGFPNIVRYSEQTIRVLLRIALQHSPEGAPLPVVYIGSLFYFSPNLVEQVHANDPEISLAELLKCLRQTRTVPRTDLCAQS